MLRSVAAITAGLLVTMILVIALSAGAAAILGLSTGAPTPLYLALNLLGGALAGIALAFLTRIANGVGARRRSRAAARSIRKRLERSAETLVVEPVEAELEAYRRFCAALATAAGRS